MFVNNLCVTALALVIFVISFVHANSILYHVPDAKIEVFKKGFRVSIPHVEGIEIFAFHGNINQRMYGIDAGQFSKDIVHRCGDFWVFDDDSAILAPGDSIYYWLFVIRNRLGYRYDNGHYIVKEILEPRPLHCEKPPIRNNPTDILWTFKDEETINARHEPIDTQDSTKPASNKVPIKEAYPEPELSICCSLFLNESYHILELAKKNEKLVEENKILYAIAEKDADYSKTLRIFGKYPTKYYPTALEFAQNLILEKLLLEDVKVVEAKNIPDNGISFKVAKLSDKVRIIVAAKKGLEGSNYSLSW